MFRLSQDLVVQSTWLDSMLGPAPPHAYHQGFAVHLSLLNLNSSSPYRVGFDHCDSGHLALIPSGPWPTTHSFPSEIQEYKPRRPTYHQHPTITLISNLFFLGPHSPLSFICRSPVYPDISSFHSLVQLINTDILEPPLRFTPHQVLFSSGRPQFPRHEQGRVHSIS
ncbi:hypothetical protein PGT21_012636 [Puccinia graminis f. sp. tritici]|uniref:Uncharacterized protein n=1 Tax=Puccinia graminis f. sp. tritici TaxID=56615 RepID=A0A5B0S274_PUCGR|nr:hypothetical protein PGT21_012636 [Puccinia graminis f. sp. tritici]KAA1132110.1 hypothetical protein PGTUg99_037202 [Puccinia graminis f. sp. tritici]